MTKLKVFKFEVSNFAYLADDEYLKRENFKKHLKNLVSYEDVEKTLNNFLEDKTLVSLNVNTIDVFKHNNGMANIVHLVYTIVYM